MKYPCHRWLRICYVCRNHNHVFLHSFMTYWRMLNKSIRTSATSGPGTAYLSEAHESLLVFSRNRVAQSLGFCVVFCWPSFLEGGGSFIFWQLYCLSFVCSLSEVGLLKSNWAYCRRIKQTSSSSIQNGQSKETGNTRYNMMDKKLKHNTICIGHHYTQTNTNNVNKTWGLLPTT